MRLEQIQRALRYCLPRCLRFRQEFRGGHPRPACNPHHDEVSRQGRHSRGPPVHAQHTHAMKSICIECGHTHGHHHQNCPELPEIQQDDIEITVTSEAEDNFSQFDLIP